MSADPTVVPQLNGLFVGQDRRPDRLRPIEIHALSPFKRALLVADGTVTQLIEAYTLEPIEVLCSAQQAQRLSAANSWLELAAGDEIIDRHVVLQGRSNGLPYASAHSQVVPHRLPESIRQGLICRNRGLGRLLIESQLETRRQLLWYGLVDEDGEECLSRTYLVWATGVPTMMISECFPLERQTL